MEGLKDAWSSTSQFAFKGGESLDKEFQSYFGCHPTERDVPSMGSMGVKERIIGYSNIPLSMKAEFLEKQAAAMEKEKIQDDLKVEKAEKAE